MTMRVPEKRAGLSLPEYRRQSGYTAGSGLSARADDAFVDIRARAEEDEREAAGRFAATAGRAAQTAAQAWDDYQTSRATQAFNAFQTSMQERMYGEDGIFTRQGEAAFSSAEDLETAMRESVQELSQSMDLNPLARVKLARQVFAFGNQALPRARKYAADQRLNWANGQDRASIELNQEAFLNNADDSDARMLNLNTMRESYERYAARNGLSEEEKTLGWKKIQSGAYGRLADKYISEGNLSAARRLAGEEALWMDGEQNRLWAKITRQEDILRAQAEAQRQEEEREAVRSLRQEILDETAAFPTLEEQLAAALARAESLEDPKLREEARAGIVREMDWSIRRRDAEIMRTGLEFRRAAREEGLSPEEQLARLEETDMPPYVRAPLEAELESGTQRLPNEENMTRAMTLLRLIDASRAGGMSSAGGTSLSQEDILAAALYGGLTDGQTEGVLAYLEKGNWLPISRLDDICLELGMPPDKRGQVLPLPGSMRAYCGKWHKTAKATTSSATKS